MDIFLKFIILGWIIILCCRFCDECMDRELVDVPFLGTGLALITTGTVICTPIYAIYALFKYL